VGIIFKGSGFYSTDYRKPEPKPARPGKEAEEAPKKPADKAAGKAKASD
jgi:predicted nucleic acid-binding Zn ribbon protein